MRIDSRFLNWGVFFILLGAIPLAVPANVLDLYVERFGTPDNPGIVDEDVGW